MAKAPAAKKKAAKSAATCKPTRDPSKKPMSELENKLADGTKDDVVRDLLKVANAEPDRVITRNYYRVNGRYKESAWNRYFGTFEEFKRQAGIKLTRHQHSLEKQIAKHASVESFKAMNVDKAGYEDKYKKPSGKRFQSVLVCSDVHDKDCDPFYRRLFVDTALRMQPEIIVFNGDIFDLYEFGKYTQDPREWDVMGRIAWVHAFMHDLREACPDAEFLFIEGNHEFRLLRHLSEATPALKAVLSDLHGFTVPKLLGLDAYQVNYISRSDLATFTQKDMSREIGKNWCLIHDCLIASHYPQDRDKGIPGWNGHHHKHIVWPQYSPIYGPYEWHQLGAGHIRAAEYCDGEKWSNGFLAAHVDTQNKRSIFEYFDIKDFAMIGGRYYERQPSEFVTDL